MEDSITDWDAYFTFSTKRYLSWWQANYEGNKDQLGGLISSQDQVVQLIQTYQHLVELDKSAAFALKNGHYYKDLIINFSRPLTKNLQYS